MYENPGSIARLKHSAILLTIIFRSGPSNLTNLLNRVSHIPCPRSGWCIYAIIDDRSKVIGHPVDFWPFRDAKIVKLFDAECFYNWFVPSLTWISIPPRQTAIMDRIYWSFWPCLIVRSSKRKFAHFLKFEGRHFQIISLRYLTKSHGFF